MAFRQLFPNDKTQIAGDPAHIHKVVDPDGQAEKDQPLAHKTRRPAQPGKKNENRLSPCHSQYRRWTARRSMNTSRTAHCSVKRSKSVVSIQSLTLLLLLGRLVQLFQAIYFYPRASAAKKAFCRRMIYPICGYSFPSVAHICYRHVFSAQAKLAIFFTTGVQSIHSMNFSSNYCADWTFADPGAG